MEVRRISGWRRWRLAIGPFLLALCACGGGGGAGGGVSGSAPQASYSTPQSYFVNQAITPLTPMISGTVTAFSVSPALPAGLTLNTMSGTISGTPTTGAPPTDYTITAANADGATTTTLRLSVGAVAVTSGSISRMVVAGTAIYPQVTAATQYMTLAGTLYAKATDSGGVFGPVVTVTPVGANYQLELATQPALTAGSHSGQVVLSLCRDSACAMPQPVPSVTVNYNVQVLAPSSPWLGNHLTTLSPIPGAPEWSTFQGNAAHTGYVPVTLDPDLFATRWQLAVPAFVYFNGLFNLATVTTAAGRFFIAGGTAITAHSEYDGSQLWLYDFSGLPFPSVNPPAVSNGTVYVAAGQQSSTFLFALNASDGSVVFRSSMSSQWENYLAPTIGASGVYTDAGTYGGLYAFDRQGNQLFFGLTAQQSAWTPSVDATSVYAYTGDYLRVFDPLTGSLKASIADPTFTNYIYEVGGAAVLGAPNSVFAAAYGNSFLNGGAIGNSLVHFNVMTQTVDWTVAGDYPATPAYDSGFVYLVNNNPLRVEARAESDGSLSWTWSPPASGDIAFKSEVLLTQNTVIVSTNLSTYAIDRSTHHAVWSYPSAGNLALSPSGILYIEGYGVSGSTTATLTAINVH